MYNFVIFIEKCDFDIVYYYDVSNFIVGVFIELLFWL